MDKKHNPIPYEIYGDDYDKRLEIRDANDNVFGWIDNDDVDSEEVEATYRFIRTACNSHYDLLEALETLVKMYVANMGTDGEFIKCITPDHASSLTKKERKANKYWSAFDKARAAIERATQ